LGALPKSGTLGRMRKHARRGLSLLWLVAGLGACRRDPEPATPSAAGLAAEGAAPIDPSARLPEHVKPAAYTLELEIAPATPDFAGHARIEVELARSVESILLHAKGLTLSSVVVALPGAAGTIAATARPLADNGLVSLDLAQPIGPGTASIDIGYSGHFDQHLRGLYNVEASGQAYAFTQFEAIDARKAFPCFDEPRFKTPFDVTLRVPSGLTAISNTPVAARTELPSGQTQYTFARTEKLPTYLVAFAVGPLDVVNAPPLAPSSVRPTPVPLRGIAAQGRGPELAFALQETPRLVESLERYFGVGYPYPKLDLIAVPDFSSGAMENAGAITFRDTLLLLNEAAPEWQRRVSVSVNAHELAHQWFGDLVTMPWWDDIWLNEGFATWLGGRVLEDVHPEYKAEFTRVALLDRAFDTDSKASARQVRQPIQSDHDIRNAFDSITYTKGAALLAMFERYLGREAFRGGLQLYLQRHRFGSGTSHDLLAALEERSGKPVAAAFSTFLDQPGVPVVSARLDCTPGSAPRLHLSQRRYVPLGSSIDPEARWQVPVCLRYGPQAGKPAAVSGAMSAAVAKSPDKAVDPSPEQCTLLEAPEADVTLGGTECPRWVFPNARAAGYYRWSLADNDYAGLLEQGYAALDPSERLALLSNTEAAAHAGTRSFEELMATTKRLAKEPERELVQAALGVLGDVRDALLDTPELPGYRRLVQELISSRQKQLGLFPTAKEDGEAKLLRPTLVSTLAFEARDAALRQDLARLGRAHLGLAEDSRLSRLPSELLDAALGVAVQEGGSPVVDRAASAIDSSSDGIERGRLLGALGSNQNPELTPTVLTLSLSDKLRTNERLTPLVGQLRQRETREAAYTWLEAHFDELVSRLGPELGAQLTIAAGVFCSQPSADRARAFFTPRVDVLTGGPRSLRQNLESSELCAAFATAHKESAHKYFTAASRL
jgi:aminopeptidase N